MLISEAQILEVLRRQNSWWQTGKIPSDLSPDFKRLAFYHTKTLLKQPGLNRAIVLTGARRVGKTVLLHQIAQDAIDHGIDPKKIFYVTFEDLTLTQANLREILALYEKNVDIIGKGTLILLDELHYTAHWSRWLMTVVREFSSAQIVATGSAAVLLRDQEKDESGAGRWTTVHVPTLSFYEYVHLRGIPVKSLNFEDSIEGLCGIDEKRWEEILSCCLPLELEFNRYLLQGGFPAFVRPDFSLDLAQRLLREDVIDKALKRDMAHLYGARSLGELDQIFVYLCFNLGSIVEKSTLAKELKHVSPGTVEKHFQRLEDAHLIYRLNPINLEGKKSLKPRPKVYLADPSLRNAVILKGEVIFDNFSELGLLIEACVYKHLYAFYFSEGVRFGYWKSSRGDKEVDFMLIFPDGKHLAFEVKYREKIEMGEKEGLMEVMRSAHPPAAAFLITKKSGDYGVLKGRKIFQIPAFIFMYLLGHIESQRWRTEEEPFGESSAPLSKETLKKLPKTDANPS